MFTSFHLNHYFITLQMILWITHIRVQYKTVVLGYLDLSDEQVLHDHDRGYTVFTLVQ